MTRRLIHKEFCDRANIVHNNKYTYPLNDYKGNRSYVTVECTQHGTFKQNAKSHLKGIGCPKCGFERSSKTHLYNLETFTFKAINIHGNKYDYSNVKYKNSNVKVDILCKIHNEYFSQTPKMHLSGQGCPRCKGDNNSKRCKDTISDFILKGINLHNDEYGYNKVQYNGTYDKVCILHKTCKKYFYQRPNDHLNGHGCPYCNQSKGEEKIRNLLNDFGIEFISQKRFKNCKDNKALPFDFYIPSQKLLIEYDGIQHFIPIKFFGGDEGFENRTLKDNIKSKFAMDNNFKLLRISFKEFDKIDVILKELL